MRYFYLSICFIFVACMNASQSSEVKTEKKNERNYSISQIPTDKVVHFLWIDTLKKCVVINEELCKTLSDPERAALGFVSTFHDSECKWDNPLDKDFTNLKCKAITALGLEYQCSNTHLNFLKKWFYNDKKSLKELENCPMRPMTATSVSLFEYIDLVVDKNIISVKFAVNGLNFREGLNWSYSEIDYFQFDKDNIRLIKKEESEIKRDFFSD